MFDEFTRYPKEKVKVFLRYLVNAARKERALEGVHRPKDPLQGNINIEKRLTQIDEERKEELETKVKAFYTKNRYMPLIVRLRRIKKQYIELKKTGKNTKKILLLKTKIEKCNAVIKKMQRLDQLRETLAEKSY
jgi:hypothetical protein